MDDMKTNELVVRKKKYAYIFLIVIFLFSVVGSDLYFSSIVEGNYALSGDSLNSGDTISGDNIYVDLDYNIRDDGNINDNYIDSNLIVGGITYEDDSGDAIGNIVIENDKESDENTIDENVSNKNNNDGENSNENNIEVDNNGQDYFSTNRTLNPDKPMVALTFDDGPDPKRTIKMLEILKKYNSVATFFDIGNLMEKYPEIVKQEVEAGCDVGGHTYSHVNLNSLSQSEAKKEIENVKNAYKTATGLELKYIRPTYGNANSTIRKVIDRPIINWSVDSLDWKHRDADKIIEEIRKTKNLDGKIILMHVIYDSTLEAVDKLIPELIEEGYQLVTISELAEYKGYNLEEGKIYYQFN